jgi:hypothetical protein
MAGYGGTNAATQLETPGPPNPPYEPCVCYARSGAFLPPATAANGNSR